MSPTMDFALSYEVLNKDGFFSEGDTVTGALTVKLTKESKVRSLFVKMKGDAEVHWTEGSGDNERSYSAKRRYFKLKEVLIAETSDEKQPNIKHIWLCGAMASGYPSEGDTVTGALSVKLTKETKVRSLFVKMKGDAEVKWTEGGGDAEVSFSAKRRYFKLKGFLIAETSDGTVLRKGDHHFKFRMKIPEVEMPTSFMGKKGKIVYMLEAKMSRSWRWPSKVQHEFKFVSKSLLQHAQTMRPLTDSVSKDLGIFSSGQVKMWASVNRSVCSPGDTVSVVAQISNSSSKAMKPKFSFHKKIVCRAGKATDTSDKNLCKVVGKTIAQNSEQTVSCQLKIPEDIVPSVHNCEILSVGYYIKVYLDISFAFDPEVVFPLFIVPSAAYHPDGAVGPHPAEAVGAPSYSDFPLAAFPPGAGPAHSFPTGPHPAPAGPGAYGYPPPDPTEKANTASGYSSQWPQQAPPPTYPAAAFPPSSAQHQAPTAPPLFQQEEAPPTYSSLFAPDKS